jgi:hypothetical protein
VKHSDGIIIKQYHHCLSFFAKACERKKFLFAQAHHDYSNWINAPNDFLVANKDSTTHRPFGSSYLYLDVVAKASQPRMRWGMWLS